MACIECGKKQLSLKLWQTSLDRYVMFCSEDCIRSYLNKKYEKSSFRSKAVGLALEFAEEY